jgi:hypothetical protein
MIETKYMAIDVAAKALDVSESTLLVAASVGHIQLYWLLNRRVWAERGYWEECEPTEPGKPERTWVILDEAHMHFMYIPLSSREAAGILKEGEVFAEAECLLEVSDADNSYWTPNSWREIDNGGLTQEDLRVTSRILFVTSADLDEIRLQIGTNTQAGDNDSSMLVSEKSARLETHRSDKRLDKREPREDLDSRERTSLLTIIAALCDYSDIDPAERGSASKIAKMTEEFGARVSDDTVRKWLKAIPDALRGRMK